MGTSTAEPVSTRIVSARGALDLGGPTVIMGILNVTPDSFSDGGDHHQTNTAAQRALQMIAEGAQIIDVGGESTRPGADPVDAAEEIRRTAPVIEALRAQDPGVVISIDTSKAAVAQAALAAGADWVNDVSALSADPDMAPVVAKANCPIILMHMRGEPRTMQQFTRYDDVVQDVTSELQERIAAAVDAGIGRDKILADPGIGFAKTPEQNLTLLRGIGALHSLGVPVVLGASRKSVIGHALDVTVDERLATTAWAVQQGVQIVRVHDVQANVRTARMTEAIIRART